MTAQRYNAWQKTGKATKEKLAKKGVSRDEFLKAPSTRTVVKQATQKEVEQRFVQLLPKVNIATIRVGIESMTPTELMIAKRATPDKLRRLASHKAYKKYNGRDINPFWYR